MKEYLRLLRVKHYIKNTIIFLPMFFGKCILDFARVKQALLGFVAFSFLSSSIYIINDIIDVENDRKHPAKMNRPLASGTISINRAKVVLIVLMAGVALTSLYIDRKESFLSLILYGVLNVLYSFRLKKIPIVDVIVLVSGFVIRMFFGGTVTGVYVSIWLYLVVVTGSMYMGLGKRRNELQRNLDTRYVLKYYNESFLEKNMYMCESLAIVFFVLWAMEIENSYISWSSPVFMIILMIYSFDIEQVSDGDPIEVILNNKLLVVVTTCYAVFLAICIYCM